MSADRCRCWDDLHASHAAIHSGHCCFLPPPGHPPHEFACDHEAAGVAEHRATCTHQPSCRVGTTA